MSCSALSNPFVDVLQPRSRRLAAHNFMEGPFSQGPESASSFRKSSDPVSPSSALPGSLSLFLKSDDARERPSLSSIANAGLRTPPSSSADKQRPQPALSMSGASALDRRGEAETVQSSSHRNNLQTAREALGAVIGAHREEARRPDESVAGAAPHPTDSRPFHRSDENRAQHPRRGSPASLPDTFGNGEHSSTLMNSTTVASPGPIEEENPLEERPHRREDDSVLDDSNKSFSYPVPMLNPNLNDPRRGMSLPHSGLNKANPRSPTKKHRCPYCATEFTRHHNLKSHLLTHSQEKPYVCQTCNSRFRRLHDLKRHTKLHTGERPHICPKCGRRFARGDALARHNKGSGGCAGRRSSMGGFGADEEYPEQGGSGATQPDDPMEGMMYTEPERMDEDEERRLSIPSIRKENASTEPVPQPPSGRHVSFSSHQPNTYPPISSNRSPGGLFPPVTSHTSSSPSPISPSYPTGSNGSSNFNPGHQTSPSIFVQTNMTESPKPLSPNPLSPHPPGHGSPDLNTLPPRQQPQQQLTPGHSPNLKPQFQPGQPQFNRSRQGSGTSLGVPSIAGPPSLNLPSPQPTTPHLPPPPGLNPPESRFTLHSQAIGPPSQGAISSIHSVNNRTDSHIQQTRPPPLDVANDSINPNSSGFSQQRQPSLPGVGLSHDRMWDYVRSLESRINGLEAEVGRLREQAATNGGPGVNASGPGVNGA